VTARTTAPSAAVQVKGLRKSFRVGGQVVAAVTGINLEVAAGEVFGLLGPNGAGKTTTLRILTTLLPADAGTALVAGADVRQAPGLVRARIGYVSQAGGADKDATGRENLLLAGRLYGLSAAAAGRRCAELTAVFGLDGLDARPVRSYSGGQRRRLEVALGIMHRPRVLFLDEPTTGLDPQNRANLWEQLRLLRDGGTTIFLTTHYLDEADQLCDRVAFVDHGQVIALGRPEQLKQRYSGNTVTVVAEASPGELEAIAAELTAGPGIDQAAAEPGPGGLPVLRLTAPDLTSALAAVFAALAARGLTTRSAAVARPSLDDVFLQETGRSLRDAGAGPAAPGEPAPGREVAA
jgi:ABC-2 type transport system ATP-binding protein